jgi:hypothetical protein
MAKAPHSKGKTREYSRRPQQKADATLFVIRKKFKFVVQQRTTMPELFVRESLNEKLMLTKKNSKTPTGTNS